MEVDRRVNALRWQIQMHTPHAGNAAHLRIDHGLHKGAGNRRVDDIAAGTQDLGRGLGSFGLGGGDHGLGHRMHPSLLKPRDRRADRRAP